MKNISKNILIYGLAIGITMIIILIAVKNSGANTDFDSTLYPADQLFLLILGLFIGLLILIHVINPAPRKLTKIEQWRGIPHSVNIVSDSITPTALTAPNTPATSTANLPPDSPSLSEQCANCKNESLLWRPCLVCGAKLCYTCLRKGYGLCPTD